MAALPLPLKRAASLANSEPSEKKLKYRKLKHQKRSSAELTGSPRGTGNLPVSSDAYVQNVTLTPSRKQSEARSALSPVLSPNTSLSTMPEGVQAAIAETIAALPPLVDLRAPVVTPADGLLPVAESPATNLPTDLTMDVPATTPVVG